MIISETKYAAISMVNTKKTKISPIKIDNNTYKSVFFQFSLKDNSGTVGEISAKFYVRTVIIFLKGFRNSQVKTHRLVTKAHVNCQVCSCIFIEPYPQTKPKAGFDILK